MWQKAKKNYYDKGIKVFWLDEAEPEYSVYDFDNYRYHMGPNVQVGNIYPALYAKTFFDGMKAEGQENIINLLRCAWAGSQKYGALVWSGDIHSSFSSLRNQFYDFPKDSKCWEVEDQYMFGPDVLVAPVTYADMRKRKVYLPEGFQWTNFDTEEIYEGGQIIEVDAPLSQIPVFTRNGRKLK